MTARPVPWVCMCVFASVWVRTGVRYLGQIVLVLHAQSYHCYKLLKHNGTPIRFMLTNINIDHLGCSVLVTSSYVVRLLLR